MTNERLEHIKRMEAVLNNAELFFEEAERFLQQWKNLYSDMKELETYYYSTQWKKDVQASNRNEIPAEIPHGVLSEDLIYNALGTQQCTAIAFLKHITKIIAKE